MQFDDRLATVLRMRAGSAAGERTQLRQLLDLLGTAEPGANADSAYARLADLRQAIPPEEQALILREPGLRLRNPVLVQFLAEGDTKVAAAAMATARLPESAWEALIPRLPVTARGLLRHRRDLPPTALRQLERLGVGDLVLSDERAPAERGFSDKPFISAPVRPEPAARSIPPRPAPRPEPVAADRPIGDIIERIEQFRNARRMPMLAPRLPLGDAAPAEAARIEVFDVVTNADGRAIWASSNVAPWIVGMRLTSGHSGPLASFTAHSAAALRRRQPLRAALLQLDAAPAISGDWRIDAAPVFAPDTGAFGGYRCRLMRTIPAEAAPDQGDSYAERTRQVLHELRTPVNAIQGFAEIIQQQLFAPVPHEYRAHAAAIAVDAARLLAGFEEVERLARLESGALVPDAGEADLDQAVRDTLDRLAPVLSARNAAITLEASGGPFSIALAPGEAMALCWRLLASAAAALAPEERVALALGGDGHLVRLDLALPANLREAAPSIPAPAPRAAVSAGMFGPQFAFRLAAAEARAAGGALAIGETALTLTMPVLTPGRIAHSTRQDQAGG